MKIPSYYVITYDIVLNVCVCCGYECVLACVRVYTCERVHACVCVCVSYTRTYTYTHTY